MRLEAFSYLQRLCEDLEMHIYEFQKMMKHLYFERDSKRGKNGTFEWLSDELEELREVLNKGEKKAIILKKGIFKDSLHFISNYGFPLFGIFGYP